MTLLALTSGVAHADSAWSEYSVALPLRPAEQLVESSCDISIELRGAIAEVRTQQRLTNPGPAVLAAMTELELAPGAQLIGVTLQRDRGATHAALAVPTPITSERVTSDRVLGADPAVVTALPPHDGRPRFRVLVQPLEPDQEIVLGTQWTAIADIRGGTLRLVLPGRGDGVTPPCRGLVHAQSGPGTSIERMRVNGAEAGARGTASFELGAHDVALDAVLAFKRREPVVWTQSAALGESVHAQLVTIATPPVRGDRPRRVLFVIDDSRSMQLVGRHHVARIVRTVTAALPASSEVEAIIFDRTAARVLGSWQPARPELVASIEKALGTRAAANGSDIASAFTLVRQVIAGAREPALVLLITDGVLGEEQPTALVQALGGSADALDLHVLALSPGRLVAPDLGMLRTVVAAVGGAVADVPLHELDAAIAGLDDFLRPAWLGLELTGSDAPALDLRAGAGVVLRSFTKGKPALVLPGPKPKTIRASAAPSAAIAQLALAEPPDALDRAVLARLRARHPAVTDDHAFVVLASTGRVAQNRRAMVAGGGPFTRMVDVDDPRLPARPPHATPVAAMGGSAIGRDTVQLLLRTHLQPAAFACYQRALARSPELAGTAQFRLELGRGELIRAAVTGLGNATFDACLHDAAYVVTPPLPNPDYNTDDRTIVNYPLTFSVREHKPFVIAGDADSSSPIDIDSIRGGPPAGPPRRVEAGDTATPLGNLRPSQTP